jgi:hypothetical protein
MHNSSTPPPHPAIPPTCHLAASWLLRWLPLLYIPKTLHDFTLFIINSSVDISLLLYIPKTSLNLLFFSETIILGIWWVWTTNSERMTQENITLRNDAFDLIIIVYMGDAQRLEKFNDTFMKTMHWGMMDGGFIVFYFLNYRVSFKKLKNRKENNWASLMCHIAPISKHHCVKSHTL